MPVRGVRRIFGPKVFPQIVGLFALGAVVYGIAVNGCGATAPFDQKAYGQAIVLQEESLSLMDRASEPYGRHEADVDQLMLKLERAHAYTLTRPGNETSARQWGTLSAPEGGLIAGFFALWAKQDSLSPVFIEEAKGLVADAFNAIEALERGKLRGHSRKEVMP